MIRINFPVSPKILNRNYCNSSIAGRDNSYFAICTNVNVNAEAHARACGKNGIPVVER